MKRLIIASILTVVLLVPFVLIANAEMAKEGTTSGRTNWIVHYKVLPMGKELAQLNYEAYGVSQSDTGEGLLHNASSHAVGGAMAVKGEYEDDSGLVVFTRPDGDQIFITYKTSGVAGKSGKGTFTYVGGTGKFVGILGSGEFTRYTLRPIKKGVVGASFSITKSQWKIIEPPKSK
jgi:hypothetical protein